MEALISEVQRRNVLWNKRNPRYKDRLIVDKEWEAVAQNTGFSKEEAKRKWRNLRDQFEKELKKVRKPHSGDGASEDEGQYIGKWQYFASLEFLKGIVAPRRTEGNVCHVLEESRTSLGENEDTEDEDASDENLPFSSSASVIASTSQVIATDIPHVIANSDKQQRSESRNQPFPPNITPSRSKRKRLRDENMNVEEQSLNIEAKKLALLETPEDENSLFLTSLVPYFKKMAPLQQLRVRTKFQEILIQEMSLQSTSSRPCNAYFPIPLSAGVSSVPSSTYSNISSPASPAESVYSATHFNNMYPTTEFNEVNLN